jgi:YD repeat-containing protein
MTCFGVLFSLSPVASKGFVSSLVKSLLFFLLLNVLAANAQTLSGVEQGIKPYGSYEGGDIDSVSMANGSLTLKIPLISYPQRGGKLHVGYSLYYSNPWLQPWASNCNDYTKHCDETGYDLVYYANPAGYGYVNPNGATFGTAMAAANDSVPSVGVVFESPNSNLVKYYTLTEPDGAVHDLGEVVVDGYAQYRSVDATGYLFVGTNSQYLNLGNLWDRHGNLYETTNGLASAEFQDSNGNQVTESATGWNDTMGRAIPGAPTSTTNLANCPASATTASVWSPPGPNGGTSQYKYCWATINISFTAPDCTSNLYCSPTSTTANEMVGLVLPNLTAWTFAYDSFGDITNITFPTGGSISYTWTYLYGLCVAPQFIDPASQYATQLWPYRRAVTSRTVNANDGTGSHTWTYVPSMTQANGSQEITGSFQTVVTDPLGNATVHSETALGGTCSIYETETQKYNGSTSGPVMQTVSTTYNYGSGGGTAGFGDVVINVVPYQITTTDGTSGQASQVVKTYDSGSNSPVLG